MKTESQEGNSYDKIFKENLEELVLPMLRQYWDVEIKSIRRLRDKLQSTTEREADFLSEIIDDRDEKFLLHVEFQSQDDPEMLHRMQEYHGIITRKYRLPIRHFVFYFGEKAPTMPAQLHSGLVFKGFTILDFKTIDFRDLLLSETGSEIVLAILADFKGRSPDAVIRLILKRLKEVSQSETELKKYFIQLNVLSRLRNLSEETIKTINVMPITIDIEKDYLYRQGIEKGKEEGKEEGREEGRAKKTFEATQNMLTRGFPISTICEILNVSEAYVVEVQEGLQQ